MLPLLGGKGAIDDEFDHAEEAVHRGAHFMRHVGEKLAFGATGGQGMLRGFLESFGALLDALFEQFLVLLNFTALLAEHLDHLVETLRKELDFVAGLSVANGAELAPTDLPPGTEHYSGR